MAEYISIEELIEALKDEYNDALRIICCMQTADVQPVAHAEWVCLEPEIGLYYSCSKCGHNTLQGMYKFCPNCGARMKIAINND